MHTQQWAGTPIRLYFFTAAFKRFWRCLEYGCSSLLWVAHCRVYFYAVIMLSDFFLPRFFLDYSETIGATQNFYWKIWIKISIIFKPIFFFKDFESIVATFLCILNFRSELRAKIRQFPPSIHATRNGPSKFCTLKNPRLVASKVLHGAVHKIQTLFMLDNFVTIFQKFIFLQLISLILYLLLSICEAFCYPLGISQRKFSWFCIISTLAEACVKLRGTVAFNCFYTVYLTFRPLASIYNTQFDIVHALRGHTKRVLRFDVAVGEFPLDTRDILSTRLSELSRIAELGVFGNDHPAFFQVFFCYVYD